MALLGTQLVITLITVSVIQKLSPYYSFSRWLLCSTGLIRYLYPTNSELRTLIYVPKKSKKSKSRHREGKINAYETFYVPKNLNIELESTKVTLEDTLHLRYYQEYQWLVDFALYASVVYFLTEAYSAFVSINDEINLSMLWCVIVLLYSIKIITSLTAEYFHGVESTGERSTVVVTGFAYLVVVMIILIVDESIIETGLDSAYANFSTGAINFLKSQGFSTQGPASKLILKFSLAVWSSFLGAVFVFPGLRFARMHFDILTYCSEKRALLAALNVNFISPLLLCLLWIKPISHDYLTSRIFLGMSKPLFSLQSFESLRLTLMVICMVFKIFLMPIYLQAYLNMAYYRMEALKTEVGKITNIDLQRKVASVFYYMCVVVLQYMIPIVICLFFTFMYKTLGEYEWKNLFHDSVFSVDKLYVPIFNNFLHNAEVDNFTIFTDNMTSINVTTVFEDMEENLESSLNISNFGNITVQHNGTNNITQISTLRQIFTKEVYRGLFGFSVLFVDKYMLLLIILLQIFTKEVYRGLFGFSVWWACFTWFVSSNLGLLYYMYFDS